MYRNYLKIAWRNLVGSKVYSGLNIAGLAGGMAVVLLIGLWVVNEFSYDQFLTGYEDLYQVKRNFSSNGEIGTVTSSSLALADKLRSEIPEIQDVAETDYFNAHGLMTGEKKLYMNGGQVGSDFLKMFRYPFLEGEAANALERPISIVLTESTAKALFNSTDVLGKTLRVDNLNDLDFPIGQFFDKGITLKAGQAPAHKRIDKLLKYVQEGKVKLYDIITHRLPLSQISHAYEIFKNKKEDCVKVVIDPSN
jgi:putative ABC transport system permease protein